MVSRATVATGTMESKTSTCYGNRWLVISKGPCPRDLGTLRHHDRSKRSKVPASVLLNCSFSVNHGTRYQVVTMNQEEGPFYHFPLSLFLKKKMTSFWVQYYCTVRNRGNSGDGCDRPHRLDYRSVLMWYKRWRKVRKCAIEEFSCVASFGRIL